VTTLGDDAGLGASSQNPLKMRNENALHHFIQGDCDMTGEEIFNQALVLTYITGILIMLYIGWKDK
tara:strand:+ start:497 stop:694 length:198 start_codon:yes stop_codon:yes gene_type:complete